VRSREAATPPRPGHTGGAGLPTPTERLETRKQLGECRVCAWLSTLDDKVRRDWAQAIANPRYGAALIASEVLLDFQASDYSGPAIGDSSVENHRRRGHR